MTTIDELRAIRDMLSDRRRWTRGAYARDAHNRSVGICSPSAVQWCLTGATYCVNASIPTWGRLTAEAEGGWGVKSLSFLNDKHGYEAVMALLDAAIEQEEA